MVHNITVSNRSIHIPQNDNLVQNNVGTESLHVSFDQEWGTATTKLAIFANGQTVVKIANPGSDIVIPWEVLVESGRLFVTFVGYVGVEKRFVTKVMDRPYRVDASGRIDGLDAAAPTPDEIQYLFDALSKATDAATKATKSANDAATSATSAAASATSASASATSAATKADKSAAGADASAKSATSAAGEASGAAASATASAGRADAAAKSANDAATSANKSSGKADAAASDATDAALAATNAAGDAGRAATSATNAAKSASDASASATAAAGKADASSGRANSAADEAEAFLRGFEVQYSNLSQECKDFIAQSAASGASVINEKQGTDIIDSLASVIVSGREAGVLDESEGLFIIDKIFG